MIWFRIDERLVHGQIIEAWLPYLKAAMLIIANDGLPGNELSRQIMLMAVPSRVCVEFLPLRALSAFLVSKADSRQNTLVLFAGCADARRAYELGAPMAVCNIGNIHYAAGRRRLCPHAALSAEDENSLRFLQDCGVVLDFRSIPADKPEIRDW
ncbi:MAG: PTS sugar transporter subunit IIB [Deltaproteobacteria bacterium]|jgi:PTS system mannose-specific IIB component|nr:PTS sugar transporter subunit IIB [Deltaproteobacteria bacterium]